MKKIIPILLCFIFLMFLFIPNANATNNPALERPRISNIDVEFLQESAEDKIAAEIKYKDAINIINNYMERMNIQVNSDLSDVEYQSFVKSLGTAFDEFSNEDMGEIVEFVKFIDLYENIEQNKMIREYKEKMDTDPNALSEEEILDIYELIPSATLESTEMNTDFTEIEDNIEITPFAYSNGYEPTKARNYAYKWYNSRNPNYKYYADYYGCKPAQKCWNDCTNFVSQSLYAGGLRQWKGMHLTGDSAWYYADNWFDKPSRSWGGAHNFYNHWKYRTKLVTKESSLAVGDAVNADFNKDGHIDHTAIVTKIVKGKAYVTQHTSDKKDAPLSKWYSAGYKVYGWKMANAKKTP